MLASFAKVPTIYSIYGRSADFPRIPNILQITVYYSASRTSPLLTCVGHTCNKETTVNKQQVAVRNTEHNVKWPFKPFKVIQGQVFWGQWKGDKRD